VEKTTAKTTAGGKGGTRATLARLLQGALCSHLIPHAELASHITHLIPQYRTPHTAVSHTSYRMLSSQAACRAPMLYLRCLLRVCPSPALSPTDPVPRGQLWPAGSVGDSGAQALGGSAAFAAT